MWSARTVSMVMSNTWGVFGAALRPPARLFADACPTDIAEAASTQAINARQVRSDLALFLTIIFLRVMLLRIIEVGRVTAPSPFPPLLPDVGPWLPAPWRATRAPSVPVVLGGRLRATP